jgi:4-aminobutyrate aminotransferase / (S)-3-amino-2-methylpropionate transaminase / 5-aminovalerate transaminase
MNKTQQLFERRKQFIPNALGVFSPASVASASGALLIDADGREMIDFAGGIGVLNAGHCPAPVVQAIQEQAAKLIHSCFNVAIYDVYMDLAEKLATLFPHGDQGTKVMLTNTGAEAVENAIKIARQATGRSAVLCFGGAFHGRSMMAMTLTSKVGYKTGCGPYAPEVYRLPFPYYGPREQAMFATEEVFAAHHEAELLAFFNTQVPAQQVAAVILEVVQGEGGFNVVSKPYLQALRRICTEKGILLILDEVQSGFGRTGKWAGYEHFGVVPDLSTWAKSMGSGMPIGCVIGKTEVMDAINAGTIGGTYAGNPVCAAASLATIRYMESIDMNAHGVRVGKQVRERFDHWQQRFPDRIGDVRGLGAMLAFEVVKNGDLAQPDADFTKKIIQYCNENGLIVISSGVNGNCIRTLSPLVISDDDLQRGLDILERGLRSNM